METETVELNENPTEWLDDIRRARFDVANDILGFSFLKKRIRVLSGTETVDQQKKGVLYWMSREMRIHDNWSLLFAQKLALKNRLPLCVVFCMVPSFQNAAARHYKFMISGLERMQDEWKELNICFRICNGKPSDIIPNMVKEFDFAALICDFSPLRVAKEWTDSVVRELPDDVAVVQVDAHNIVPCWDLSDKQEYSARTFRTKMNAKIETFLTPFPPITRHPFDGPLKPVDFTVESMMKDLTLDDTLPEIKWAVPGYEGGMKMLHEFINKRLKIYANKRNDPSTDALSHLSPWLHFGQISSQRCVLEVVRVEKLFTEGAKSFQEEAIVRCELSDNFCFYNPLYDDIRGAPNWAQETLSKHRFDEREYIYSQDDMAKSLTHDPLWNSAQLELVQTGKMHGYMRMYWAKKILEWSNTPEEALRIGIYLNDHFSLDGRDPNGYVGVMWAVCGVHDQGWAERKIFGKIRYMNYVGCKRKFNIGVYIAKWGGKEHPYIPKKKVKAN